MRGVVLLLVLGGCDAVFQLQRGPTPDAPPIDAPPPPVDAVLANHDEDEDGVDDAIDNCPNRANTDQVDGDGDGVGLACDPHPSQRIDRLRYFSRLDSLSGWTVRGGQWEVGMDSVRVSAASGNQMLFLDLGAFTEPTVIATLENVGSTGFSTFWDAGVFLATDLATADLPPGLICYAVLPGGALQMYDNRVPGAATARNASLSLAPDPLEVTLTAGSVTPAVIPLCSARRSDGSSSSTPTENNNTPLAPAHVGLYSYEASVTFLSVTVIDRLP